MSQSTQKKEDAPLIQCVTAMIRGEMEKDAVWCCIQRVIESAPETMAHAYLLGYLAKTRASWLENLLQERLATYGQASVSGFQRLLEQLRQGRDVEQAVGVFTELVSASESQKSRDHGGETMIEQNQMQPRAEQQVASLENWLIRMRSHNRRVQMQKRLLSFLSAIQTQQKMHLKE
ncbi:hypothetical protein ACQZV8_04300 [Magnetococcales bacterium HHB-1]